jgi:hypothetical protein
MREWALGLGKRPELRLDLRLSHKRLAELCCAAVSSDAAEPSSFALRNLKYHLVLSGGGEVAVVRELLANQQFYSVSAPSG